MGFQAIQRFETSLESCEREFEKFDEDTLELISDFDFLNLCTSLDPELEDLRVAIEDFDLRASNVSQGVATLGRLASKFESFGCDVAEVEGHKPDSISQIYGRNNL